QLICVDRNGQSNPILAHLIEKFILYILASRIYVDLEYPRRIFTEYLPLHFFRKLRVLILLNHLFGNLESLESLNLPVRRPNHRGICPPKDVVRPQAIEQRPHELCIPGWFSEDTVSQPAKLGVDVLDLRS